VLTDNQCRNAKPKANGYRLTDHNGLHLFITPKGKKLWRYRFRIAGKGEQTLSLGEYPKVGLKEARLQRDEARDKLDDKQDPRADLPADVENTFQAAATRWHTINLPRWHPKHARQIMYFLAASFADLGSLRVMDITALQVLLALRKMEAAENVWQAHRVRGYISKVFALAIGEGLCDQNPAEAIKAAMSPLPSSEHHPAVETLAAAQEVLKILDATPAHPVQRLAIRLLALTLVRPGKELAQAKWDEFQLGDEPVWVVPASRVKTRKEHIVPLSVQAVETLQALKSLSGRLPYIFPNMHSAVTPMHSSSLGNLLRRAGLQGRQTPHGFRATASTILNEKFPADRLVIDMLLSHEGKGTVEGAYNRAVHRTRRRELLQIWADMLDLPPAAGLLKLRRKS
jgi:integrase